MDEPIEQTIDDAGEAVGSVFGPLLGVAIGVAVAYVVAWIVGFLVRRVARRHPVAVQVSERCRRPFRSTMAVVGAWVGLVVSTPVPPGEVEPAWRALSQHGLLILLIIAAVWLAMSIVLVAEDAVEQRFVTDRPDNRQARRVQTQAQMVRRVVVAVLWVCALAAILMTFPSARAVGASVLASAGVISIVAGLAAQTALANVFAGMQLAFTDAMRVDDVVDVEGEFGRIEEITLTYVVVHIWDDRRLVLPSTYFTSTPFENWTRRGSELLGTVDMDLDWRVPVADLRAELNRLLEDTDMWDRRAGSLQLTEATGGWVRARTVVSAENAGTLYDLRCYVREGLVDWLQREAPYALPRTRLETGTAEGQDDGEGGGAEQEAAGRKTAEREEPRGRKQRGRKQPSGPEEPGGRAAGPAQEQGPGGGGADPADEAPAGSPRRTPMRDRTTRADIEHDARFFTSVNVEGLERAKLFSGPGQEVMAEREETAERNRERDLTPVDDDERRR